MTRSSAESAARALLNVRRRPVLEVNPTFAHHIWRLIRPWQQRGVSLKPGWSCLREVTETSLPRKAFTGRTGLGRFLRGRRLTNSSELISFDPAANHHSASGPFPADRAKQQL